MSRSDDTAARATLPLLPAEGSRLRPRLATLGEEHGPSRAQGEGPTNGRRSPWRQDLVDAERGLALGLRSDSSLIGHLFYNCLIVAAGGVLQVSLLQWLVLLLAGTLACVTQLGRQALHEIAGALPNAPETANCVRRLAMAAVLVANTAWGLTVLAVFAWQLRLLWSA